MSTSAERSRRIYVRGRRMPDPLKFWRVGPGLAGAGLLALATHPMVLIVAIPLAVLFGIPWNTKGWR
jgi:hypothetical protein